jgi:hypothetical protein
VNGSFSTSRTRVPVMAAIVAVTAEDGNAFLGKSPQARVPRT